MKKLMLTAGLLATLSLQAKHKHEGPCGEGKVKKYVMDSLSLNEVQKSKMKSVFDETCAKFKVIKESSIEDKVKKKDQIVALKKEMKLKILEILDEQQKSKLKSKIKDNRTQNFSADKVANRMTKRMKDSLELTQIQQEKVKAINLDYVQRMKGLKEQKTSTDKKIIRELIKKINEGYSAQLKSILTETQFAKFQLLKEARKNKSKEKRKAGLK